MISGVTTLYIGRHYEKVIGAQTVERRYFYADSRLVTMKEGSIYYRVLTDHLGSTNVILDQYGQNLLGELRYGAWGETRYSNGTLPTNYRYTGQL